MNVAFPRREIICKKTFYAVFNRSGVADLCPGYEQSEGTVFKNSLVSTMLRKALSYIALADIYKVQGLSAVPYDVDAFKKIAEMGMLWRSNVIHCTIADSDRHICSN